MGLWVVGGGWFANAVLKWEAYYERLATELMLAKIERNHVRAAARTACACASGPLSLRCCTFARRACWRRSTSPC